MRVGDCFQVGTAVLMAMQPRRPCVKLGIRLAQPSVVREFAQVQRSSIILLEAFPHTVTIQDVVACLAPGPHDLDMVQALLATPYSSASWHERLTQLVAA